MKNDNLKFILSITISVFLSSLVTAAATGNLFDSSEVVYDNTNTNLQHTDVQGTVDDLYAAATDYSTINSRLSDIENRWVTDNNVLEIKGGTGYTDKGINIYDDNNVRRSDFVFNTGTGNTNIVSYNATGGWNNFGGLSLWGSPVYINVVNVSDVATGSCTIDSTYTGKSSWGNVSYVKLGRVVILNIYEIYPKGFTNAGEYRICTGLPKASGSYKAILANANGNSIYRVSLDQTNLSWFYSDVGTTNASGQLIYISEK